MKATCRESSYFENSDKMKSLSKIKTMYLCIVHIQLIIEFILLELNSIFVVHLIIRKMTINFNDFRSQSFVSIDIRLNCFR